MNRRQDIALGALGVLLAFGACEAIGRAGVVRRGYLPPASEVLARAVELAADRTFLDGVAVTLRAWALGLALASAIAIPLGLLLGSVPVIDEAVRAVIEFLRPLPSVALIPLVSLLLGSGTGTEVALITYASVWPILFNTVHGLSETDPVAKDTLRAFGFGRLAVLLHVELPATAPFIAAGLRISAATALILAIATELLSGFGQGLGIFIAQAQLATDGTRDVLAGVVWAGVLGLVINGVLVRLERLAFPWTAGRRGRNGSGGVRRGGLAGAWWGGGGGAGRDGLGGSGWGGPDGAVRDGSDPARQDGSGGRRSESGGGAGAGGAGAGGTGAGGAAAGGVGAGSAAAGGTGTSGTASGGAAGGGAAAGGAGPGGAAASGTAAGEALP
ncbi:ABC transporter permease [Streptomyces sp. NPDC050538]|uniref:ABC transporter permease n=1 Tax=Streptomyces sp. NPDC050538 TaxID=3365627 RepID=UPI0037B1D628